MIDQETSGAVNDNKLLLTDQPRCHKLPKICNDISFSTIEDVGVPPNADIEDSQSVQSCCESSTEVTNSDSEPDYECRAPELILDIEKDEAEILYTKCVRIRNKDLG